MDCNEKLAVLSRVGQALNRAHVTWAVGASLLLYLNGKTDVFHDIDLMTTEADVDRVEAILLRFGERMPPNPDCRYQTKHFLEFLIDGVEFDVMAGFVIVSGGAAHDCSLRRESIASFAEINGVSIPLQSMADWRGYYALMGRMDKVALIDAGRLDG